MKTVSFEVAKKLKEHFNIIQYWEKCDFYYSTATKKKYSFEDISNLPENVIQEKYYPAPYIDEIIDFLEENYDWSIYITPRFDGFDKAQIGTHYEIYKVGGKREYSSNAHVGTREESGNRAIFEVINLIERGE